LPKTDEVPDDLQPSDFQFETRAKVNTINSNIKKPKPVQFPLSVFFALTGLIALICMFVEATGLATSIFLAAMAIAILFRAGVLAAACFAIALLTVTSNYSPIGTVVCVGLGGIIASWPIVHSTIFSMQR